MGFPSKPRGKRSGLFTGSFVSSSSSLSDAMKSLSSSLSASSSAALNVCFFSTCALVASKVPRSLSSKEHTALSKNAIERARFSARRGSSAATAAPFASSFGGTPSGQLVWSRTDASSLLTSNRRSSLCASVPPTFKPSAARRAFTASGSPRTRRETSSFEDAPRSSSKTPPTDNALSAFCVSTSSGETPRSSHPTTAPTRHALSNASSACSRASFFTFSAKRSGATFAKKSSK
mmetsp:Transcript_14111/g.59467  ORF Transcript_14111/g.59467 Transcript_14111/m.59467 type:complete len:234 (+) Transcript_14111:407-1108(+)